MEDIDEEIRKYCHARIEEAGVDTGYYRKFIGIGEKREKKEKWETD